MNFLFVETFGIGMSTYLIEKMPQTNWISDNRKYFSGNVYFWDYLHSV